MNSVSWNDTIFIAKEFFCLWPLEMISFGCSTESVLLIAKLKISYIGPRSIVVEIETHFTNFFRYDQNSCKKWRTYVDCMEPEMRQFLDHHYLAAYNILSSSILAPVGNYFGSGSLFYFPNFLCDFYIAWVVNSVITTRSQSIRVISESKCVKP